MTSRHDLAITAAAEAIKALGYPDGFDPMLAAKASVEAYDAAMPDPECPYCGGTGERLWHAPGRDYDDCALAGGIDDCNGQLEECPCERGAGDA